MSGKNFGLGLRFFFGEAADGGGAGVLNVGEGDADVAGERGFDGFVDLGFDFQRFGVGEAGFGVLRFKANFALWRGPLAAE